MKSGFCTTTSDNQLSGWTKKKLQSTFQSLTCIRKMSWSLFGGLLPVWSTIAFWILAKPLHLRSMLSKSLRCTKNQMPAVRIDQQNGPSSSPQQCMLYNQHFKSCTNWAMQFCLICHIHLTSHHWLPLFQASWWLFAGKTLTQPAGCRKSCPRVYHILKHRFFFFFATGINKLISHWQKCVDSNGSYFD